MPTNRSLLAHLLLLVAAALPGQSFVVDAAGGPGSQFTNLQAAVLAVPDGSTLLVRTGQYSGFQIDQKGLTVLADPGAFIYDLGSQVRVVNTLPQQTVTIRGFEQGSILGYPVMWLENNAGRIQLESMQVIPIGGILGAVHIENCADVRMLDCIYTPRSFIGNACINSTMRASRCVFFNAIVSGLYAADSSVELADTAIIGGTALFPSSVLDLSNSEVRILAGSWLGNPSAPVATIDGTGNVRIDPSVPILVSGGPGFGSGINVTQIVMPVVSASTSPIGGHASASMLGPAGAIGILFVGLATAPNALVPGLDPLILDPLAASVAAGGGFGPPLNASYTATASLLGMAITWQGASLHQANGLQVSNGVTYTHH